MPKGDEPFSTLELASPEEVARTGRRLLEEQLARVWATSPFYQEKWGAAGRGAAPTPADLEGLPFTTKDELRNAQAADPPFGTLRAAPQDDIVRLHVTSGTTGRPLAIGFTREDVRRSSEVGARAFWAAGVRREDIVLHCLNYAFYVGGVADHLSIEHTGALMIPVGIGQTERLLRMWGDFRPTAIFCTPSYLSHLAGFARGTGREPTELGLRLLVVGGEPGGDVPEIRARIGAEWGAQVGDTYGLGEVWPTFAGQCEGRDGLHLTTSEALWWELADPATGSVLPPEPGAEGEIVYTHLQRDATPLVRYRSGDVVILLEGGCRCGRRTPRIRLRGRSDEMFQVRGVNVFPQAMEALLTELVPGLGHFALLIDAPAPSGPVPLFVECEAAAADLADRIKHEVRLRLQFTCLPTLVPLGSLRLEAQHKAKRVFRRYLGDGPPELSPGPGFVATTADDTSGRRRRPREGGERSR